MRFCLASCRRWAVRPIVATVAPDRSRPRHRLALDRGPATLRRPHDQSQQPNRYGEHSRVISPLRTHSTSRRKSLMRVTTNVSRWIARARRASFGAPGHPVASPGGAVTLRWPQPHTSPGLGPSRPNEGIDGRAPARATPRCRKRDRPTGARAPWRRMRRGLLASGRGLIAQIIGRLQGDDLAFDSRTHFVPS
jgi:hypothetical protein